MSLFSAIASRSRFCLKVFPLCKYKRPVQVQSGLVHSGSVFTKKLRQSHQKCRGQEKARITAWDFLLARDFRHPHLLPTAVFAPLCKSKGGSLHVACGA